MVFAPHYKHIGGGHSGQRAEAQGAVRPRVYQFIVRQRAAGVHETVHGLGYGEDYALSLGEYAAARNGLFTVFGADFGGGNVEASGWLTGANESYLWDINEYYTTHDASTTQSWMDGPNTGFIKDFDGSWTTHNELRQKHPEIAEAENRVALAAGLIGGGIMLSPVATAALGPTVGGLVVNGVGLALSIPVVQDGADALGTWVGSENLSAEEKWALGARIGFGGVGVLSAPLSGIGIVRSSRNFFNPVKKVYRLFGGDAKPEGFSWTDKNPRDVPNYREAAGLPSGGQSGANNTGRFVIEGTVDPTKIIKTRSALPLDGNKGGLPELIIDPKDVTITRVSGVNPEF